MSSKQGSLGAARYLAAVTRGRKDKAAVTVSAPEKKKSPGEDRYFALAKRLIARAKA